MPSALPSSIVPLSAAQLRSVSIFGATGTIGQTALRIVAHAKENFIVAALTAQDNVEQLAADAKQCGAKLAVIGNEAHYAKLKELLSGSGIEARAGEQAVLDAASMKVDVALSAIVGGAGLKPTLTAMAHCSTLALANKESLVMAGSLVQQAAAKHKTQLVPVDSEHSGIFQLLQNTPLSDVDTITITASGGPFREWNMEQMQLATPEQAVKHPNWRMGKKISVDSATLMNKGLELIEAKQLFPLAAEQFDVIVHPESIVHCLIAHRDGSVLAQLSNPDMATPIAYALSYPKRIDAPVKRLDLGALKSLHFETPDTTRFPALALAKQVLQAGGAGPIILNAANEIAVQAFLNKRIGFLNICTIVEKTLSSYSPKTPHTLDDILACDAEARRLTQEHIPQCSIPY